MHGNAGSLDGWGHTGTTQAYLGLARVLDHRPPVLDCW